jgi:hypothetical protein
MRLEWHTVTPSHSPKFMVKGTELNQATVPGTLSRFVVVEVRAYDADRMATTFYQVRDAETVSDADVAAGRRPLVVYYGPDVDAAVAWAIERGKKA